MEKVSSLKLAQFLNIKKNYSKTEIGKITAGSAIGGMRGIIGLLTDTSEVDPDFGLKLRGLSIAEIQNLLPKNNINSQPYVEGLFWLLLTGEICNQTEFESLRRELIKRSEIPNYVFETINALPKTTHPMTQLIIGSAALQKLSIFQSNYSKGALNKKDYWKYILEDALSMVAKVPVIAAYIYRRTYHDGKIAQVSSDLDWASNFANMMGYSSDDHAELMKLYLLLHADHEGGNVSAHAAHLVGSALSDPFLCYSASMAGLAGPLHGLANQECLKWLLNLEQKLEGQVPTKEMIVKIAQETLAAGNVIPGYGHAVLRTVDPRFTVQKQFALDKFPEYPLFKLVNLCSEEMPKVLLATGKVKNPYPNIDCISGTLLRYYGIHESEFFTVLFGVSRSIGVASQLVWARILGLPIERPNSITLQKLEKLCIESNNKN